MLNDFPGPQPIQFQGKAWARRVLKCLGWSVHFQGLPAPQGVAIVYPHTSNWDFPVAMLAKAAMGIEIHFWAKHSLFKLPLFGRWLTSLGGVAIDRTAPGGVVQAAIDRLRQARAAGHCEWIGLSPEGTRSYQPGWRSGFYRLALGAEVPLGVGTLDYDRRELRLEHFIRLSGDPEQDYARIRAIVGHARGYHPESAAPVRPLPTEPSRKETP
jgi:1-acyl-sn-glycerol-3-phosphate acyltransferase